MSRRNHVFYVMWSMFYFVFLSNFALVVLDWNTGPWSSSHRLFLGIPLAMLGLSLLVWGIATLGTKNTSGIASGFVSRGPYRFTRNPQYIGDFFLFSGVVIIANSEFVLISHLLTSLVFVLGPLAEEPWLEETYGDAYLSYRRDTPRFL